MHYTVTNLQAYFASLHLDTIEAAVCGTALAPWLAEAHLAAQRGHCHAIKARTSDRLYLMRFWLSEPDVLEGEERWDSSDSLLLHHFLMPDDDNALHDHPWNFRTTILSGGYHEALPPENWLPHPDQPGPSIHARRIFRGPGTTVHHAATDLHSVSSVLPNTWTLVRTGPKQRTWYFHPEGSAPVHYRDYLNLPAAT